MGLIHSKNKIKVLLSKDPLEPSIFNKLIFGEIERNANLYFQM